jgi:hypothetical protein
MTTFLATLCTNRLTASTAGFLTNPKAPQAKSAMVQLTYCCFFVKVARDGRKEAARRIRASRRDGKSRKPGIGDPSSY